MNRYFSVDSNYGHIHIGFLYVGWNNIPHNGVKDEIGDETFGLSIGNLYVGCYSVSGWCAGFLDENGCLE